MNGAAAIILCAGKGTRMGDDSKNKVCFDCAGVPVIRRIVANMRAGGVRHFVVVVGHRAESVMAALDGERGVVYAYQREQKGNGFFHSLFLHKNRYPFSEVDSAKTAPRPFPKRGSSTALRFMYSAVRSVAQENHDFNFPHSICAKQYETARNATNKTEGISARCVMIFMRSIRGEQNAQTGNLGNPPRENRALLPIAERRPAK